MLKTVDLEQITSTFYAINCRVSNMRKKCLFILLCNIFKYISLFLTRPCYIVDYHCLQCNTQIKRK